MVFTSFVFILFFIIALISYYITPHKLRWFHIIVFSYIFYGYWKIEYLSLLIVSTLIDFLAGYYMGKKATRKERLPYLIASILFNLGLLITFKYYNFFYDSFLTAFHISEDYARIHRLDVLLPVGISFYTFQTMSYTIDVYNGRIGSTRHLGKFAAFVAFFPQLVAGPIERASNLLPQFDRNIKLDYTRISNGLKLMAWGFFKKIIIADRLMVYINNGYADLSKTNPIDQAFVLLTGVFMVYVDFSAYTDIAKGSAQTMGFSLMDNFKQPFFSRTISGFWSRWHISMTTWFKDYIYTPLLLSKGGSKAKNYFGLYILFLIIGLWHGANWTFVIWAELICTMIVIANFTRRYRNNVWTFFSQKKRSLSKYVNFLHEQIDYILVFLLLALTSPFFFAKNVKGAFEFYVTVFNFKHTDPSKLLSSAFDYSVIIFSFFIIWLVDTVEKRKQITIVDLMNQQKTSVRYIAYIILIFMILNFGNFKTQDFIYFQF